MPSGFNETKVLVRSDRKRVVHEYGLVHSAYPDFELKFVDGLLDWEGEISERPLSVAAPPFRFRVEYPAGFPVAAIKVFPISPALPPDEWGHEWHRWEDGRVCIVKPNLWDISYTAYDVIEKVGDWYFNYLACKHGLITKMPDTGRAKL